MGVDIVVWRSRIGAFNLSARRFSGKRAKPGARAGRVGLEVVILAAILLLVIVGEVQVQQYSQHQERCEHHDC